MAKQKLGQHFLRDRGKAEKIVMTALRREGPVLEIGPGNGALTDILDREGGQRDIISVEKDAALIPALASKGYRNVQIIEGDILKTDPARLLGKTGINLLGNIPYLISREIMDWIIGNASVFSSGVLMVQKEFFLKVTSAPGSKNYNAQSVMFNTLFETEKLIDVPPGSFSPPPKVTSTVFTFIKRGQVLFEKQMLAYYKFLKTAFRSRRKTLVNNLGKSYKKDQILQFLESESLSPAIRAEDMSPESFVRLFNNLEYKI